MKRLCTKWEVNISPVMSHSFKVQYRYIVHPVTYFVLSWEREGALIERRRLFNIFRHRRSAFSKRALIGSWALIRAFRVKGKALGTRVFSSPFRFQREKPRERGWREYSDSFAEINFTSRMIAKLIWIIYKPVVGKGQRHFNLPSKEVKKMVRWSPDSFCSFDVLCLDWWLKTVKGRHRSYGYRWWRQSTNTKLKYVSLKRYLMTLLGWSGALSSK